MDNTKAIHEAILTNDVGALALILEAHDWADQRAEFGIDEGGHPEAILTTDQLARVESFLGGAAELTAAELAPWIAMAVAFYSTRALAWHFRAKSEPVTPFHWTPWRMLTRAPDIVDASRGTVLLGWIVDDLPPTSRRARDIKYLEFHTNGEVTTGDFFNLSTPGMAKKLEAQFQEWDRARLERMNRWTGDFDE